MRHFIFLSCLLASPVHADDRPAAFIDLVLGPSSRNGIYDPHERFLQPQDVFSLQWASDPQISPDGKRIVYVRNFFDKMKDRQRSNLWIINTDGKEHRPLTTGLRNDVAPRWSPRGDRVAYLAQEEGNAILMCRWLDSHQSAQLAHLRGAPSDLTWSPDGQRLAFAHFVPEEKEPFIVLPGKPKGADWADPPKVIDKIHYRFDGQGYLKDGNWHLFVIAAEGGAPRQITRGRYDFKGPFCWSPDSTSLLFSAHLKPHAAHEPKESEIHELRLDDRAVIQLTKRQGPDLHPVISPDGKKITYLGLDDRKQGYQVRRLYVMNRDGSDPRCVSAQLDRDVDAPLWRANETGWIIQFDDQGVTKIGLLSPTGKLEILAEHVGGTSLGRPYASGSYSATARGEIAFTLTSPNHPAEVAFAKPGSPSLRLTHLNKELFAGKALGQLEEVWCKSAHDGRKIQAWLLKPPELDLLDGEKPEKHPLILEIHGGPFANYGPRFAMEHQLYAARGYNVLFVNPRGSTSYGEEFGNLIHHNYPSQDYDDLMSAVDAVQDRPSVDKKRLYVTGGSGGGVLSSWTIGKTHRFRAAVVVNPVINWYSFVLTSDIYPFFAQYWFPGPPWENAEHYLKRSPISLVGNVKTPTMVLCGENDHRTPISEAEQYFQALQLRKVKSMLVRIPGAPHNIAARPSQLMAKAACVLRWIELHDQP
jgi:acylaminoacyl-peptidase